MIEGQGPDRRVIIGKSVLAGNATVSIDPDKLFGRHLAVIGNTGSGKSCSVAGLIRWSLQAAAESRTDSKRPNARVIVLDPNGEYVSTFSDIPGGARIFQVPPVRSPIYPLHVPAWLWNSYEWSAFSAASARTQRPLLLESLRNLRSGADAPDPVLIELRSFAVNTRSHLDNLVKQGPAAYAQFPKQNEVGHYLTGTSKDLIWYVNRTSAELQKAVAAVSTFTKATVESNVSYVNKTTGVPNYNPFSETHLRSTIDLLDVVLGMLPAPADLGASEDAPIPFDVAELPQHLKAAQQDGFRPSCGIHLWAYHANTDDDADDRLKPLIGSEKNEKFTDWLDSYIGADEAANGQVAILNLSLVPTDVVHIVVAVVARVVFEAIQRYRKLNTDELPTILVLEEAHNFIQQRPPAQDQSTISPAEICRSTFEKIAREGRKFGLGLVLPSQRPSELSPTVLAQCNTFLLDRIVNDRDQELIKKLVPDNVAGLLGELPNLPSRQAVLLGGATPIPVLVEISELPESQRPRSDDPHFWEVWTGQRERKIDWSKVAEIGFGRLRPNSISKVGRTTRSGRWAFGLVVWP